MCQNYKIEIKQFLKSSIESLCPDLYHKAIILGKNEYLYVNV